MKQAISHPNKYERIHPTKIKNPAHNPVRENIVWKFKASASPSAEDPSIENQSVDDDIYKKRAYKSVYLFIIIILLNREKKKKRDLHTQFRALKWKGGEGKKKQNKNDQS
jgi:hypothetical protein